LLGKGEPVGGLKQKKETFKITEAEERGQFRFPEKEIKKENSSNREIKSWRSKRGGGKEEEKEIKSKETIGQKRKEGEDCAWPGSTP